MPEAQTRPCPAALPVRAAVPQHVQRRREPFARWLQTAPGAHASEDPAALALQVDGHWANDAPIRMPSSTEATAPLRPVKYVSQWHMSRYFSDDNSSLCSVLIF